MMAVFNTTRHYLQLRKVFGLLTRTKFISNRLSISSNLHSTIVAKECLRSTTSYCFAGSKTRCRLFNDKLVQTFTPLCKYSSQGHPDQSVPSNSETKLKVYTGQLTTMVKLVKMFSLSTSAIGILMQPIVFDKLMGKGLGFMIFTETMVFLYAVLTPVILHLITKRYIVSMDFNPDTKVFTLVSLSLFFRRKELNFCAEDVSIPDITGPFTTFAVKGVPYLFDPKQFTDPSIYAHLMGYDKPLNLHLNEDCKKS